MKVCPLCNRVFGSGVDICEHDGQRLIPVRRDDTTGGAPIVEWDGPLAGDIVGSYRLESMIAEGGMGRIFRATHLTLGRRVAIKFLLPEHAARADLVQRFFNEARSVNAVRHPHILEIYDFIQERSPNGPTLVYMLMEHLEGEDLRVRISRERFLSPSSVVGIAIQVAEALATAHDAGILHRDLKPDNIFLCNQPPDFVKVLDFGAAKAFGDRPGANLTRPGVAIGTPEYMAPEQIKNKELDGRVDEYALGIVLYELLTGDVPFASKNVAKVLAMHTREAPPRLRKRRKEIPPALEAFVLRCLEKDPNKRFPDLWSVADALREVLPPAGQRPWPTPASLDPPSPLSTLPLEQLDLSTGPLPSPPIQLPSDALSSSISPTPPPTVEAGPRARSRARDAREESGMPTLDRRFDHAKSKPSTKPSSLVSRSTSIEEAPPPSASASAYAPPVDRHEREAEIEFPPNDPHAPPRDPSSSAATPLWKEPRSTEEVKAVTWKEQRRGDSILGLLRGSTHAVESDDDDEDLLFVDLVPHPPSPSRGRHPILLATLALLFMAAIAFAVFMFLS